MNFTSFVPGNIAIIDRGSFLFSEMADLATAAGAPALIVSNIFGGLFTGDLLEQKTIPVILVTQSVGAELLEALNASTGSSFAVHLLVEQSDVPTNPVPEPGTLALLGTGLLGLVGVGRRRAKT